MLSRNLIPILLLFISTICIAQKKDTVRKYLDQELHFTSRGKAVYQAYVVNEKNHWVLSAYYPDSTLLVSMSYKNHSLTIKDGPYEIYFPKSVKSQSGSFIDDKMDGLWQSWYRNGHPKDSGAFIKGQYVNTWKHWYENGNPKMIQNFTSTPGEIPLIIENGTVKKILLRTLDGSFSSWYENGNCESAGTYSKDSLEGEWQWFREDGTPSTKEKYSNSKLVDLSCYNNKGEYTGATCSVVKIPVFIHSFFKAADYIVFELSKLDKKKFNYEGNVLVQFTVFKDAKISRPLVDFSSDKVLNAEIEKILMNMKWSPAISHNRPIDYQMRLIVPYYK